MARRYLLRSQGLKLDGRGPSGSGSFKDVEDRLIDPSRDGSGLSGIMNLSL